jgi:biotin carboxylase
VTGEIIVSTTEPQAAADVRTPATGSAEPAQRPVLRSLSEIYQYFRKNTTPIYFVSPTPYNLLGLEQWVGAFHYVTYFDSFDGSLLHSFSPMAQGPRDFESFESVNTYLLSNREVIDYIERNGKGQVLLVMFDEQTEAQARELGLSIALPPRELRERIDSKLETTRLGNEAGVASVPNLLTSIASFEELATVAAAAGLGDDLVVQTPYGDSGRTTFFIRTAEDFASHAELLVGEQLKIMRRINHLPGTLEAVATRHGTLVGPIQTDLTGYPELTPYRGGWCGNDIFPGVFDQPTRDRIRQMTHRLGDRLYQDGYKGVFCMDFLVDTDDGTVYLGEINPRISGASPLNNLVTSNYGGVPAFLFHLLEFADVDWELDVEEIQRRWSEADEWSQLVLKQVTDEVELITAAPLSGLWRIDQAGEIRHIGRETDWHTVVGEDEAFYLRVYGTGEYRYPGADIGVLVTRGRMQTDDRRLTERGRDWAKAIHREFSGIRPEEAPRISQRVLDVKWF